MIKRVRHHALRLKVVFQATEPTQLVPSMVKTIWVSILKPKKEALGVVSLVTG